MNAFYLKSPGNEQKGRKGQKIDTLPSESYVPKALPTILGTFDMTSIYLVAIFFIVNAATAASGGPAAFTYLLLGALTFFIPSAIATAQLGYMFPHEGSLYNWTHQALGGYWSFFIGFCAWFPGVLVMIAGADIVVGFIQALNPHWLTNPYQQGIVIVGIILFSFMMARQRTRMVQNIVNVTTVLMGIAVVLIGLSSVIWLLTGHHSMGNFHDISAWTIHWRNASNANINLFGLITLAYLGTEVPLNMGGEIRQRKTAYRHLLWGTILVLVGYFVTTFSLLVIRGNSVGIGDIYGVVDTTMGKVLGTFVAIALLSFTLMIPIVYNSTFARLLLVGAIDNRLPTSVGRLNKNRVPVTALLFQTIVALTIAILTFFVVPYVVKIGNPLDLSSEVYNVSQASATLVWAISSMFFFINLAMFCRKDKVYFLKYQLFPMPVLILSGVVGVVACVIAIGDTLLNSWIPGLISNAYWWYIIGGVTLLCIIVAGIGSMIARSEAEWEDIRARQK
jgi:glutamate:GABA antiporter